MKKVYIEPEIFVVVIGKVMDVIEPSDPYPFNTNQNNTFDEEEVNGTKTTPLWDTADN